MKFGITLAASAAAQPEWQDHYINYGALKQKLQQAKAAAAESVDVLAAAPLMTSLSIPCSRSQPASAVLAHLQGHTEQQQQQMCQAAGPQLLQQLQMGSSQPQEQVQALEQQPLLGPVFGNGLRVPEAILADTNAAEQFLQLLQQELTKVHRVIQHRSSSLAVELQQLAAAAPQLAQQHWQVLEAKANDLGRQLLALEGFMQLNQAGFVKIVKKHDKLLPDAPIWHLYLHHLQHTPWLEDQQRQHMWALLSSCYYHLHAASILASSKSSRVSRPQQQQQQQQVQKQQPLPPHGACNSTSVSFRQQNRRDAAAAAAAAPADSSQGRPTAAAVSESRHSLPSPSSKGIVGGLSSAFGSAVAGAASAVAGAATAVAAAATAAAGVPVAIAVPSASPAKAVAGTPGQETVSITLKFWVKESDVPSVMYLILQHLPLLPSSSHSTATAVTSATTRSAQVQQQQQQQQQLPSGSSGFTTALHTVYFDNQTLELYHGRLYLRPQTQTLKARWIGDNSSSSSNKASVAWAPAKVVLERKIYKEGWRGEPNEKDALLIAGDKLPSFLVGAYTLGDALANLCEVPALRQQLVAASATARQATQAGRHQQKQQQQQQRVKQSLTSPFATSANAAAAATGASPGRPHSTDPGYAKCAINPADQINLGLSPGLSEPLPLQYAAPAAEAAEAEAAVLAASITMPQGLAIGSLSSTRTLSRGSQPGSNPSLLQLLQQERQQQQRNELGYDEQLGSTKSYEDESTWQQQQQQQQQAHVQQSVLPPVPGPQVQAGGAAKLEALQQGFADAYLDPPMPSADQLSLFTEVQRLVGRKGLRPVLHCVLQRMLFAMPFDDRIRITLDTDVKMVALEEQDVQLPGASLQQQSPMASGTASRLLPFRTPSPHATAGPVASQPFTAAGQPDCSSPLQAAVAAGQPMAHVFSHVPPPVAAAATTNRSSRCSPSQLQHCSSCSSSPDPLAVEEAASLAAWQAIYASDLANHSAAAGIAASRSSSCPGTPLHGDSSSSAVVHTFPYALLKVSVKLPARQEAPTWLQQLAESDSLVPVEDWSKFLHGCAVLMPETVRAVPYFIDDELIDMSVQVIQAQLEAEATRRDQQRLLSLRQASQALSSGQLQARSSSGGSLVALGGHSRPGGADATATAAASGQGSDPGFSNSPSSLDCGGTLPTLGRIARGVWSVLGINSSSGGSGSGIADAVGSDGTNPSSRPSCAPGWGVEEWQQQPGVCSPTHAATAAASGPLGLSRLRVSTPGPPLEQHVTWASDVQDVGSNKQQQQQQQALLWHRAGSQDTSRPGSPVVAAAAAAAAAVVDVGGRLFAGGHEGLLQRWCSLGRRQRPPPLFRPESSRGYRLRRGNPVQLLESRDVYYSEAIFLEWLRLAITMASVAVLLMGYSSVAYVNPLKRSVLHMAEVICLLMLPCSCIIVGYALRVFIWRGKRLNTKRFSRMDDQVGPLLMALMFVCAMSAIMLVNIADLVILLRAKKQHDDDDESVVTTFFRPT